MTVLAKPTPLIGTIFAILAISASVLSLNSCGQKGPLVLPQPTVPEPAVKIDADPVVETAQPATNNEQ